MGDFALKDFCQGIEFWDQFGSLKFGMRVDSRFTEVRRHAHFGDRDETKLRLERNQVRCERPLDDTADLLGSCADSLLYW